MTLGHTRLQILAEQLVLLRVVVVTAPSLLRVVNAIGARQVPPLSTGRHRHIHAVKLIRVSPAISIQFLIETSGTFCSLHALKFYIGL